MTWKISQIYSHLYLIFEGHIDRDISWSTPQANIPLVTCDSSMHMWSLEGYQHNLKLEILMFPKIGVPQNGWFRMKNPIKLDDLGIPLFLETPTFRFKTYTYDIL